jgi:hypothetical protein
MAKTQQQPDAISTIQDALLVIEEAVGEVRFALDYAMQRGEWIHPVWQELAASTRKLARQSKNLSYAVRITRDPSDTP